MELLKLIFKGRLLWLAGLTGLGIIIGALHVCLLVIINGSLDNVNINHGIVNKHILSALALLVTYLLLSRWLASMTIRFVQTVIYNTRMSLIKNILGADYQEMKENEEAFYSAISRDSITISNAASASLQLVTSLVTVVGCLVYLMYLSVVVLLFVGSASLIGIGLYVIFSNRNQGYFQAARTSEDSLFYHVKQVINGFREVKINPGIGHALLSGPIRQSLFLNFTSSCNAASGYYGIAMISQSLFYFTLIVIIVLGPDFASLHSHVLTTCIIVTLYLIGPLETVTALIPSLGAGEVAAGRINKMVSRLSGFDSIISQQDVSPFEELTYERLSFEYPQRKNEPAFRIGPVSLRLEKGEVAFIYGQNGAGKTTLLHLLLGILEPNDGKIQYGAEMCVMAKVPGSLFSPIFSDFHLFDRFYGFDELDLPLANRYLELFELTGKVSIDQNKFSVTDLSTGQRKRLALISCLLEKRPILVLDEWAADQDPAFRKKFYTVIIPMLRQNGFTILAVTHDDKYFSASDSLYRMEFGSLFRER